MNDGTIDVSNMSEEEFVIHMRELDKKSRCPCNGCTEQCANRSECDKYREWVRRYVLNG